jgi:hypothetical protein
MEPDYANTPLSKEQKDLFRFGGGRFAFSRNYTGWES